MFEHEIQLIYITAYPLRINSKTKNFIFNWICAYFNCESKVRKRKKNYHSINTLVYCHLSFNIYPVFADPYHLIHILTKSYLVCFQHNFFRRIHFLHWKLLLIENKKDDQYTASTRKIKEAAAKRPNLPRDGSPRCVTMYYVTGPGHRITSVKLDVMGDFWPSVFFFKQTFFINHLWLYFFCIPSMSYRAEKKTFQSFQICKKFQNPLVGI